MEKIAILIPCYNEELTIQGVIEDFLLALPTAQVFVYDNNSNDNTASIAKQAGATVRTQSQQGKGYTVMRMFADIEADIYIMVDGDGTYDAKSAPALLEKMKSELVDMVIGSRTKSYGKSQSRLGHSYGNQVLAQFVNWLFKSHYNDLLSGYRVFSRRFVKSCPLQLGGFEIETFLSIHAAEINIPIIEIDTDYSERPSGSHSKLNTILDGVKILKTIIYLYKEAKPFQCFCFLSLCLAGLSLWLGTPVILVYFETGLVDRFPTAFLSASLMVISTCSFFSGIILDSVSNTRRQLKRLNYLSR